MSLTFDGMEDQRCRGVFRVHGHEGLREAIGSFYEAYDFVDGVWQTNQPASAWKEESKEGRPV